MACAVCGKEGENGYCADCGAARAEALDRMPKLLMVALTRGFRSDGERDAYERCVKVLTAGEVARLTEIAEKELGQLGFIEMMDGG